MFNLLQGKALSKHFVKTALQHLMLTISNWERK